MKGLDERVAVVTGGASGVGAGIAAVLAREGARVAIADLDADGAERLAASLAGEGHAAVAVSVDLVDAAAVEAMAATVLERWGRIDILSANAGVYPSRPIEEVDDEFLDRVMDLNVKGALHSIKSCLPAMREAGYGRVVLTSSITGNHVSAAGYSVYGSTKAAMLGLMRGLALEVVEDGITINAILPGNVRTPVVEALDRDYMEWILRAIPMGRLAEPEELGWAVRFLASEEAAYITGQTLVLDGGQLLPEGAG
ncbi:MAG TPA: glucose 1-dehydrogenase [Solirubrobacterales bacterium]|nr:glucose 1-dehydrogenase [Solirubrobacterales bacterium]